MPDSVPFDIPHQSFPQEVLETLPLKDVSSSPPHVRPESDRTGRRFSLPRPGLPVHRRPSESARAHTPFFSIHRCRKPWFPPPASEAYCSLRQDDVCPIPPRPPPGSRTTPPPDPPVLPSHPSQTSHSETAGPLPEAHGSRGWCGCSRAALFQNTGYHSSASPQAAPGWRAPSPLLSMPHTPQVPRCYRDLSSPPPRAPAPVP